jgi:hypothetical protein
MYGANASPGADEGVAAMTELPDGFTRQNGRRYVRLVMEIEVEVADPVALRAALLDRAAEVDGQLVLPQHPAEVMPIADLVMEAATPAIHEIPGLRFSSGWAAPRYLDDSGENYAEHRIPPLPARRDDGTRGARPPGAGAR